jgi:hypothetical protein
MEYVYNVADVSYPVSIRDQMNRARWLVRKAFDLGFFGPYRNKKYRKLLVCGAGAAGVTAALHALSLGVQTHLVERSAAPFLRQRSCTSRWLDPTQYDWSADFWTHGSFPYPGAPWMALPWSAGRSSRIARNWRPQFLAARANPRLTYRSGDWVVGAPTRVRNPAGGVVGVRVRFQSGKVDVFGILLYCAGFGDERRTAPPSFKGFAFWETDPFERGRWGVPAAVNGLRGLVSGGGDGALQDVIRLATRLKSARDVYLALAGAGWTMPGDVRHDLFTAEDQAQRTLLWCPPGSADEHNSLQQLHVAYVHAVNYLLNSHATRRALRTKLAALMGRNPYPLLLVHSCTHFARGYGLNHFLVLLLAGVNQGFTIRSQVGVSGVSASAKGHVCGNPWSCHGVAHDVHLEQRPWCYVNPPGVPLPSESAHVVVIRHGIQPNPVFAGTPLDFARQVLPYHLP